MYDVMIDLENLCVHPDGAILTAAFVQFDIKTGQLGQELYLRMDRTKAVKYGFVSPATVDWWESRDPAARAEAYDGTLDPRDAAHMVRDWFRRTFPKPPFVWGNGSCMDIVQLEFWLRRLAPEYNKRGDHTYPWNYWDIMDMRTIMRVAKLRMPKTRPAWVQHHNALHDAKYQIEWVVKALAACRNVPGAHTMTAPPALPGNPHHHTIALGNLPPPPTEEDYQRYNQIISD